MSHGSVVHGQENSMNIDEVESKAIELLGQAQPVSRQPKKETVMSFKDGPVYMGLKLVSPFDKDTQEYGDPVPKIVFLVDGKYVRMPLDSRLFGEFGKFLIKLFEVTEGIKVPEKEIDMDRVKEMLSGLRVSE